MSFPKITIVTVTYNAEKFLEETIQSVISQDYTDKEYIIIDGGSTDSTIDIIKKYQNHITYWKSEPDKGLYDAMNKGIKMATGDWICFMNAGDKFFNNAVLTNIFTKENINEADCVYGNVEILYKTFSRIQKARPLSDYWQGMICSHQAMFVKINVMKELLFNLRFNLAADFDVLVRLIKKNCRIIYIPQVLAIVSAGGLSDLNQVRSVKQYKEVLAQYDLKFLVRFYYFLRVFYFKIKMVIKNSLPKKVLEKVLFFKYLVKKK